MTSSNLLQAAVTAARTGQRERARQLLLKLVEDEPHHEMAWLWLSDLVDSLDDRIIALENALVINPDREQTRTRLAQLRRQKSQATSDKAPAATRVAEALQLVASGRRREGLDRLNQLVADEPENEDAWWEISRLVDSLEEQMVALEKVLSLNPYHRRAEERLTQLQRVHNDPLALGRAYEERGDLSNAIVAYRFAAKQSTSSTDRTIAQKRLRAAEEQLKLSSPRLTSPTTTLLRLMAGPPILYALLLFVHSGLDPLHLPLSLCLGTVGVVLGSMLVVATLSTQRHSSWAKILSDEARQDPTTRLLIALLGILLIFIPYLLLSLNAVERLEAYRAILPLR